MADTPPLTDDTDTASFPVEDPARCPDCGEPVALVGKQTPATALGLHRRKEHGVVGARGSGGPRKTAVAPSRRAEPGEVPPNPEPTVTARQGLRVVGEAAGDAGAGKGRKRAPTAADLEAALGRIVEYATDLAADWMVDGDPAIEAITDPAVAAKARARLVEDLSMSKREAQVTVRPVAQLAAGTQINAKVGRHIVENVGLLETAAVVTAYVRELRAYRIRRDRLDAGVAVVDARSRPTNARTADGQFWAGATSPPPAEGRVMSAEDVAAMRGQAGPQQVPNAQPEF